MSHSRRTPTQCVVSSNTDAKSQPRPQGGQPPRTQASSSTDGILHGVANFNSPAPLMRSNARSFNLRGQNQNSEHTIDPRLLGHPDRSQSDPERWVTDGFYGNGPHETHSLTMKDSTQGQLMGRVPQYQPTAVLQQHKFDTPDQQNGAPVPHWPPQQGYVTEFQPSNYNPKGGVPYPEPDTEQSGYNASIQAIGFAHDGSGSLEDAVIGDILARQMNEEVLRQFFDSGTHNHDQIFEPFLSNNDTQLSSTSATGHQDLPGTSGAPTTRSRKRPAKRRTSPFLSTAERVRCRGENCRKPAPRGRVRCKRCQDKYDRNNADPPQINFDPFMSWNTVTNTAYPMHQPLCTSGSDHSLWENKDRETEWVGRFINAATTPYDELIGEEPKKFYLDQQQTFNGKAFMENHPNGRYTDLWINVRMRMLFHTAVVFHDGGRAVYPIGGDSGGYGRPDVSLAFLQRLETIEDEMKVNKLVVMNIIEGKGVVALVENPSRFKKRKIQNKNSNETKNIALEKERKRQRKADARLADSNADLSSDDSEDDNKNEEEEIQEQLLTGHLGDAGVDSDIVPPTDRTSSGKTKRNTDNKAPDTPRERPSKRFNTAVSHQRSQEDTLISPTQSHLPSPLTDVEQSFTSSFATSSRNGQNQTGSWDKAAAITEHGTALSITTPDPEGHPIARASGSCSNGVIDPRLRGGDSRSPNEPRFPHSTGARSAPDAVHEGEDTVDRTEMQTGAGIFGANLTAEDYDSPRGPLLPDDFFPNLGFNDFGM